ncbi:MULTISPECIES: SDR family oxidoreductase [unclassified Novosphingobium]|uniref:SDR family oxidoreductase n=1 Tax=unclassified Novosphingobium TaxID=2644732 RepID=UPI001445A647|nr:MULTISPECIES: SDR family oxidoreductase [unclassified Novosphingobium]NKJ44350.1 NAD(P)-dependent dehydrogenase (short-subunit alcohol dehydrogenase family) [Novosphingobium sp. SG720]NMN05193.1 NAD(P)-dependent dehydrogenase (short-subunit alcohol dehydrogenase family) [Novosphingobium sp. SG919]NMN87488.1 NAD(P)-dependent dehydrogenase (short-subunit alcohol dehydrogenase family) [Novosphingobium sp. SG916]
MAFELDNVVAVVTGARGGIGREVVRAMKAAGATVVATDVGAPEEGLADHALAHDVTSEADWQAVADLVGREYGRLDALVNVAGISVVASIEETPLAEWRRINAVNVESVVIGVQTLLPLLKEGGKARASGASIVNFSSVGGIKGAPFNGAYCTSKAAVKMLSKCMGAEFAALGYNIRANSVHPGGIDTPMLQSIMQRYVDLGAVPSLEVSMQGVVAAHPIGRLGRPAEMAGGVVYLCSDAASFVTCSEFMMDGGYCMS